MYSGTTAQELQQPLQGQEEPITNDPQPKSKREPVSRLANELICLAGEAAHLMLNRT